jgi:methionyl-tRNA synthetase
VLVANLAPATLRGIQSNGMVLAASHEGTMSLLTLDRDVPPGSKVK